MYLSPRPTLMLLALAATLAACGKPRPGSTTTATQTASTSSGVQASRPESLTPDNVLVYYFHGTQRCRTCMGIQRAIQDTVTQRFSSELASGALSFREVNTEEPANAHFATDFDLSSSGMVLVARHGETTVKWLNCEQVWPLAHDTVALGNYAESQIRAYLALLGKS